MQLKVMPSCFAIIGATSQMANLSLQGTLRISAARP